MPSIGVGFAGAGTVVQAIHLPTLARLADLFHVAAIWDGDARVAEMVAARAGAGIAADFDTLLADPAVEILAVCTPGTLHADQVIAAMRAGKRAVFCEKPLATTAADARRIGVVAQETGVPLIVGAMHLFDPAWLAVQPILSELAATAHMVRSSIVLPFNTRFEAAATEPSPRPVPAPSSTALTANAMMRLGVMELAIHDLPIVRALIGGDMAVTVTSAELLDPIGYAITIAAGDRLIDLFGHIGDQWSPHWEIEAIAPGVALHIAFTPSFVHAGSGQATVTRDGVATRHRVEDHNGYEGEWLAMAAIVGGDRLPPDPAALIDDILFAIDIADQACALTVA